jgi:hypothetical protein
MENVGWFQKQADLFESSRFGAMTLMMTFSSCLGSIGAMVSIMHHFYPGLVVSAILTMASNVAFIGQLSSRLCLAIFYTAVLGNTAVILLNVLL